MRAASGVCRHKQLPLPGRQNQQPSWSCIWEILNAGKRASKRRLKFCWLKLIWCICQSNEH